MKFNMSFEKIIKKEEVNKRRFREEGQREMKRKIISKVYENYRTIKEIIMNILEGLFKMKDKKLIQQTKCRKANHWKETDGQLVLGVSNYL